MTDPRRSAWLRGPIDGIPPLLQSVAHALVQVREEARAVTEDFPTELLWKRPAGVASVGFHLRHLSGVIDRLLTYARAEPLSDQQMEALRSEERPAGPELHAADLLALLDATVDRALEQLRATDQRTLTDTREVGRQKLPSTVQGLLFHAAEHAQRHVGQLLVTVRILQEED